jgi:Flp pilus assembly protein TadG
LTPRTLIRDESGTALVEFALVLPLLLILVLGLMDFGRAFNHWIDSTHLANVAARYAVVNKDPGAPAGQSLQRYMELQAATKELRVGSAQETPVDVCISFPARTANVGDPVQVTTTSTWSWLHYLVGRAGLPLNTPIRGTATMRLEAKPTNYTAGCA